MVNNESAVVRPVIDGLVVRRLRHAFFSAAAIHADTKYVERRAETEQDRPAIWGPYRREVDAVTRSEAVRHITSGFQQPDVGTRARANRGNAAPIGREAAENEGVWRAHRAGLIAVPVEPFELTDGPRSAENQSPGAGSSHVRMIREQAGSACE